jgi:hypothetical protein
MRYAARIRVNLGSARGSRLFSVLFSETNFFRLSDPAGTSTREHDVFFSPAMDLAAMWAGQPRPIQLCFVPQRFFNRFARCR